MAALPTNLRATFELFRLYRPEIGIEGLLREAGVGTLSPRQVYHAVHNRPPDSLATAAPTNAYDAVVAFAAALSSPEFQERLAERLLHAYPEKRRLYFVHIPKTGGSDLGARLFCHFPTLSTTLLDPVVRPTRKALFLAIKHILLELGCSDTILIAGHTPLAAISSWDGNGIRCEDEVFTVIRDPGGQVISQLNYIIGRIFSDEDPVRPDTAGWRSVFHVSGELSDYSKDQLVELGKSILRNAHVVKPNVLCKFLGNGSYDGAVWQTVAHDLEVTELNRLDAWATERWGLRPGPRVNESVKYISRADLSNDDLDYIRGITESDQAYYDQVVSALERLGSRCIRGRQILS